MGKSKVQIIDFNLDFSLKVIEDINQYEQIDGVWAAFDSYGKCLNVAETKNIAKEMQEDISYMDFGYEEDTSWKMAVNHFGDDMFKCPSARKIAKYTWANVAKQYDGKEIYFVVFISSLDKENSMPRSERRRIEKYIAYKTRAVYWRDGRPFIYQERMKKAVKEFIESFENEKENKKIISSLQTVMNPGFLKNSH